MSEGRTTKTQQVQIVHRDYLFDTGNRYDNYDYIFRDDLQCTNLPYQPITIHPTVNSIGVDFNQVVAERIMFSEEEDTESFENLQDQFETIHLGKTYRNTHNIVSQLMTLSKYKKESFLLKICPEVVKPFIHTPSHGHFVHGPQLHVGIYHAGYQKNIKFDFEQFESKKLIPHILSQVVTSDGKKNQQKVNACILFGGFYFSSEDLMKGYAKDYPSVLFSSGYPDFFYNIHSTEFTECHIVWDTHGSPEHLPLDTINFFISELSKSKTLLEEVTVAYQKTNLPIPDETRLNLSESEEALNDAISKLTQYHMSLWNITYETSIEEISEVMNQIKRNLNLLRGHHLESRLLLSYQWMSEKFGELSVILSELKEEITRTNFFWQLDRLQQVNWSIGILEDEILSMTSTSDLCPEEAEERATLLETRTMTMKVHSILDKLVSDMNHFLSSDLSIGLTLSLQRTIPKLQLTNKYFASFFEKCGDNGKEDHEIEIEKLRNTRDLLNANVCKLRLLNDLSENSSEFIPSFDYYALQFLFNAISRTRVLCRVHVLFSDRIDKTPNKSYWRKFFPDARIKYVNIDEINW